MKKIFMAFLVAITGVALVSCASKKEATAPEIKGTTAVEIEVGEAFDPKAGVTATDEKDGDLTSKIVITSNVDVNRAGKYEVKYTVTNSSSKTTTKTRAVTVNGLGGLMNGDFAQGLEGWSPWYDTSKAYEVNYGVEEGKAVIDIKVDPTDEQWWGVQLSYKALKLKAFESYKLVFTVSSENDRYMNYQIKDGGLTKLPFGERNLVTLSSTPQTIERDFFVTTDAEGSELQFSFGNFTKGAYGNQIDEAIGAVSGKIYLSNVQIVKGPELENQAPVIEAKDTVIQVGTTEFLPVQGVTVTDDRDSLQAKDLIVKDITEGEKFKLPAVEGVYTFEYSVTDSGGLTTTVTRKVIVAVPWGRPTDLIPSTEDLGWYVSENNLPEGTERFIDVTNEEGITKINVLSIGATDWYARFRLSKIQFIRGTYKVTFEAKADAARKLRTAIESAGLPGSMAFQDVQIGTDWAEVTLTYEFANDQFNKSFDFMFGSLGTNRNTGSTIEDDIITAIYLRNFNVEYTA